MKRAPLDSPGKAADMSHFRLDIPRYPDIFNYRILHQPGEAATAPPRFHRNILEMDILKGSAICIPKKPLIPDIRPIDDHPFDNITIAIIGSSKGGIRVIRSDGIPAIPGDPGENTKINICYLPEVLIFMVAHLIQLSCVCYQIGIRQCATASGKVHSNYFFIMLNRLSRRTRILTQNRFVTCCFRRHNPDEHANCTNTDEKNYLIQNRQDIHPHLFRYPAYISITQPGNSTLSYGVSQYNIIEGDRV